MRGKGGTVVRPTQPRRSRAVGVIGSNDTSSLSAVMLVVVLVVVVLVVILVVILAVSSAGCT